MLHLARVVTLGALQRNESRGAHYKPDFPERDDSQFMKTTIAVYQGPAATDPMHPYPVGNHQGEPQLSYENIDVSLIQPRARKYDVDKSLTVEMKGERK
jgi:succinate dehydrogenase / fumarate reductase flavoprotein subunit